MTMKDVYDNPITKYKVRDAEVITQWKEPTKKALRDQGKVLPSDHILVGRWCTAYDTKASPSTSYRQLVHYISTTSQHILRPKKVLPSTSYIIGRWCNCTAYDTKKVLPSTAYRQVVHYISTTSQHILRPKKCCRLRLSRLSTSACYCILICFTELDGTTFFCFH